MTQPISRFVPGPPRLHYLEWNPSGARTLLLLHGGTANAWWWEELAGHLCADFRLVALDQRGHGDSQWVSPPAYGPQDYARDLDMFLRQSGLLRPVIVGHSQGGISALAFMRDHPNAARALVAIDIALTSSPRRNRYLELLKGLPTVVYPDLAMARARFTLMPKEGNIPARVLERVAEKSLKQDLSGGYTFKFDRAIFHGSDGIDVLEALRQLHSPVLLVRGGLSRIMKAEAAERALRLNPLARLEVVEGCYHHLLLESPDTLGRLVRRFVDQLG